MLHRAPGYVAPVVHALESNAADSLVTALPRFEQVVTSPGDEQHPPATGQDGAVDHFRAGLEDIRSADVVWRRLFDEDPPE